MSLFGVLTNPVAIRAIVFDFVPPGVKQCFTQKRAFWQSEHNKSDHLRRGGWGHLSGGKGRSFLAIRAALVVQKACGFCNFEQSESSFSRAAKTFPETGRSDPSRFWGGSCDQSRQLGHIFCVFFHACFGNVSALFNSLGPRNRNQRSAITTNHILNFIATFFAKIIVYLVSDRRLIAIAAFCVQSKFWFANPFSPYSIQKRPEPQICPKFVPRLF